MFLLDLQHLPPHAPHAPSAQIRTTAQCIDSEDSARTEDAVHVFVPVAGLVLARFTVLQCYVRAFLNWTEHLVDVLSIPVMKDQPGEANGSAADVHDLE